MKNLGLKLLFMSNIHRLNRKGYLRLPNHISAKNRMTPMPKTALADMVQISLCRIPETRKRGAQTRNNTQPINCSRWLKVHVSVQKPFVLSTFAVHKYKVKMNGITSVVA